MLISQREREIEFEEIGREKGRETNGVIFPITLFGFITCVVMQRISDTCNFINTRQKCSEDYVERNKFETSICVLLVYFKIIIGIYYQKYDDNRHNNQYQ